MPVPILILPLTIYIMLPDIYVYSPNPVRTSPWKGAVISVPSKGQTCRTKDNGDKVS